MTRDHKSRHFKNQTGIIRGSAEDCSLKPPPAIRVAVSRGKRGRLARRLVFSRCRHAAVRLVSALLRAGVVAVTASDSSSVTERPDEQVELMTLSLQDVYAANILDTVRQPVLLLSADLRVVTANPAFYDLCHLTPGEADDQLVYELGHGEWRDPYPPKPVKLGPARRDPDGIGGRRYCHESAGAGDASFPAGCASRRPRSSGGGQQRQSAGGQTSAREARAHRRGEM
jgi:PAS domain-containing protein